MKLPLTLPLLLVAVLLTACGDDPIPEIEVPSCAKVAPEQIAEAAKHGVPVAFENDLGMRFVLIPAGRYVIGAPPSEDRPRNEEQQPIVLTRASYVQVTEVTNGHLRAWKRDHVTVAHHATSLDGDNQPARVDCDTADAFAR